MPITTILLIIALILAALDVVLWNATIGYRTYILTPAAVVFVCISLLMG